MDAPREPRADAADPTATSVVELSFAPLPEHVRTARLVAVSVGRRVGLDDERLDEVRLAVGEACARAVRLLAADEHSCAAGSGSPTATHPVPVRVFLDDRDGLHVRVQGPLVGLPDDPDAGPAGPAATSADDLALAVVRGVVPRLTTEPDALTLHWPAGVM